MVQTLAHVTGVGGVYEPLVVTPAIGVRVEPEARILPLDGSPLPVSVTVHAEHAADGTVDLKLPEGWRSDPAQRDFPTQERRRHRAARIFGYSGRRRAARAYSIEAVAHVGDQKLLDWLAERRLSGPAIPTTSTSPPSSRRAKST